MPSRTKYHNRLFPEHRTVDTLPKVSSLFCIRIRAIKKGAEHLITRQRKFRTRDAISQSQPRERQLDTLVIILTIFYDQFPKLAL